MKNTKKKQAVYAFIDSQNLNLGVLNDVIDRKKKMHKGWKLDFKKFRRFLKDKYHVEAAYLFIGYLAGNELLYTYLQKCGYILVVKPTTTYKDEDGKEVVKGNVDTDLVLYAAAIEFANYDKAVIVSGDGDFLCLYDYLSEHKKLLKILIPNKLRYSKLLNKYHSYFDFVSINRNKLEYFKQQKRRV
jgi:uncharacterized LabA/DUF88 family protein